MVHGLAVLLVFPNVERKIRRQAQDRRHNEAEKNGGSVVVLGEEAQRAVRMSEQKRPTLPNIFKIACAMNDEWMTR